MRKTAARFPSMSWRSTGGKHLAFSPDGTHIVASGATEEELESALQAAGIHFSQVVFSYIDGPDVSRI
jgi:hypothetical protein